MRPSLSVCRIRTRGTAQRLAQTAVVAAGLLAAGCSGPEQRDARTGPTLTDVEASLSCPGCNVVLLTMDTVRADHMGCLGYPHDTTPELCALAEQGLLFEHAYSAAPSTFPALTSMLCGSVIANENLADILAHNEAQTYVAEELGEAGYLTAGFTDHQGFGSSSRKVHSAGNLLRGFDTFENFGRGKETRGSAELTEAVLGWLDDHQADRFFLWAHYFDPHFNWVPPPELEERFGYDPETCGRVRSGMDIVEIRAIEDTLSEREVECLVALHDAELFYTDRFIGRVLDRIDDLGLGDRTLIVVTADHGEEFKERTRIGHEWTVYNELIHVPLVIRQPGSGPTGRVGGPIGTASLHDMILGAVLGRPVDLGGPVVSRTHHYYGKYGRDPSKARTRPNQFTLVDGGEKAILTQESGRPEAYDLAADPGERQSLADSPEALELLDRLERWLADNTVEAGAPSEESRRQFNETRERLKALGYVR